MQFFPVVLLVGPRQSGKTTLAKYLGQGSHLAYTSFDDINNLARVQLDPVVYLQQLEKPAILDEVQRAPEIFLPIKMDVDNNRIAGRYLLTGSANPLVVPRLGDSLAGRMALCNLWPLSQGELLGVQETFLAAVFSDEPWTIKQLPPLSQKELIAKLFTGGFPPLVHATTDEDRKTWCNNYLSLTLQKDINDLAKIEGFAHLPALLYGLAARVGATLNIEELARLTKTASTTLRRYLQLLESLFLIHKILPWSPRIDSRLTRSPKVYFVDTALLLHVFNLTSEQLQANLQVFGHVLENFVVMELVKQASWHKLTPSLYHYRQEQGIEVDLIIETQEKVIGIEIKLSSVVRSEDLKGFNFLKAHAKEKFFKGIVLYMGDKILPFGDKMWAVPLNALWSM
jgi:predicted AAA+ superfamily ATPase